VFATNGKADYTKARLIDMKSTDFDESKRQGIVNSSTLAT